MVDVSVQEIVEAMQAHGGELLGDGSIRVARVAALEHATADSISFLSNPRFADLLESTPAACLIVAPAMREAASKPGRACIVTDNPYAWYAHFTQWWKRRTRPAPEHHIHPSAVVHPEAEVHETAIIGPLCVVERGARVGAHSWLKSRVQLSEYCSVGERCIIHPGAVIGADGFGFAPVKGGGWAKIEQLGAVRIGNDVEIGANTCVDRGAIDDTVIEDGVKLDNLIQIAHNVHLGRNVAMAANAGIAGSTTVEEGVTIGGAANIMGHSRLVKGVNVSATTFVSRSILKPGTYSGHFPFDDNASWEKNAAVVRQLAKLRERIRTLERQLSEQQQ